MEPPKKGPEVRDLPYQIRQHNVIKGTVESDLFGVLNLKLELRVALSCRGGEIWVLCDPEPNARLQTTQQVTRLTMKVQNP
jgi:hypothetical protein